MSGLYSTRGFLRQMLNALLARHIANIPEIAQQRPWSMLVSECALGRQERYICPVLLALAWCIKCK